MPETRSPAPRRRKILFLTVGIVATAVVFYLPLTLLAPILPTQAVVADYTAPHTVAPTLPLPAYGDSAIAAVGYPGVLARGGGTGPMPIASITKIITALVVLQKDPLGLHDQGPGIVFTAADAVLLKQYAARDGDVYPIQVGGSMSERNVLTVALVASANNYARALVDWAFGSESNFLPVAAAWLATNGLSSTILTDATGLNPQNTSTPTDLIALGKIALANPVIAQLVATKSTTLPVVGTIKNTNGLLGMSGIDGIKTGTLIPQGSSLLFSSRLVLGSKVVTLVGVVLDGPNHPAIDAAIEALVTAARAGFHRVTVASKGQRFATYRTVWGARSTAVAQRTVSLVVWGGTAVAARIAASSIRLGKRGSIVGLASFAGGGQRVTVPLELSSSVVDPGPLWRLANPKQLF